MKKTYMIPTNKVVELELGDILLEGSNGGVDDGASLLNEYDADDVSYGKADKSSMWDNLW